MTREQLITYIQQERNTYEDCGITDENIDQIANIIEYFGMDMYRPITRLLLSNWEELSERIQHYTEADWVVAKTIQENTHTLDLFSIAMLLEVLEGEDTENQRNNVGRGITKAELAQIRREESQQ